MVTLIPFGQWVGPDQWVNQWINGWDLIKIANDLVEQTNTFQSLLIHIVFIIKLLKNVD